MKKLVALAASTFLLTGCSALIAPSYALPKNCDISQLQKVDSKYEIVDQTAEGSKDSRDCAIGVPNSDVGIFFGYSVRTDAQWTAVTEKLKAQGYKKWNSGVAGADTWRRQEGALNSGVTCSISGHVSGLSFSVTEPWTACEDVWNKQLVGYILTHARKN